MNLDDFLERDIVNFLEGTPVEAKFDPASEDNIDMLLNHGAYSYAVNVALKAHTFFHPLSAAQS